MANKFTKGILERQEREFKQQHAASQPEPAAPPIILGPPMTETLPESGPDKIPKQAAIKKPEPSVSVPLATGLETYIIRDGGRKAKNKTFYLDGAVIQAVKRTAAAQRIPESKLVNDILKKVLLP